MSDSMSPSVVEAGPFRSLLAAWSMVVVVLAVAGFSARWSYYYNFGLQNLVLEQPLSSLPINAIEILRNPRNLIDLGWLAIIIISSFEVLRLSLVWVVRRADEMWFRQPNGPGKMAARAVLTFLSKGIVLEAFRASLIVYIAFLVGGAAGTRDYQRNVVDSTSRLPTIAAILSQEPGDRKTSPSLPPISCDTRPLSSRSSRILPQFIGDTAMVKYFGGGAACSSRVRTWRLLYRDDKFVYLFATVSDARIRPDTIVLPHSDAVTLVMR